MSYAPLPDAVLRQTLALTQGDRDAFLKLGAQLSPADRQAALQAAVQALPSCWGIRSQNCTTGRWDQPSWATERCRTLGYGYVGDFDQFQAAVTALPYCDETAPLKYAAVAGVVGVLLGLGLGAVLATTTSK